jgi:hypothetical protein
MRCRFEGSGGGVRFRPAPALCSRVSRTAPSVSSGSFPQRAFRTRPFREARAGPPSRTRPRWTGVARFAKHPGRRRREPRGGSACATAAPSLRTSRASAPRLAGENAQIVQSIAPSLSPRPASAVRSRPRLGASVERSQTAQRAPTLAREDRQANGSLVHSSNRCEENLII